jgi:hypothetical protein
MEDGGIGEGMMMKDNSEPYGTVRPTLLILPSTPVTTGSFLCTPLGVDGIIKSRPSLPKDLLNGKDTLVFSLRAFGQS